MRRSTMLFTLLICATLLITNFGKVNAEKVLVNIWDGTEWTKIESLYNELPNAQWVGDLGKLTCSTDCFEDCGCEDCCMRTQTKPQHATMLTGVLADDHGVFSNSCYEVIPDGLTVYERIELEDKQIRTAHISSKGGNFGEATFGNILKDVDYFIAESMSPKAAADIAIKLIHAWRKKDFFIVCHFKRPDATGHDYGVHSDEYEDAIFTCDKHLGRILDQLAYDGILEETKTYVLSDHGFGSPGEFGHGDAPNTFIISNDQAMADYIADLDSVPVMMHEVAGFLLSNFLNP